MGRSSIPDYCCMDMDISKKVGLTLFLIILGTSYGVAHFSLVQTNAAFFPGVFYLKWVFAFLALFIIGMLYPEKKYSLSKAFLWSGFLGNIATYALWHSYLDFIPTGFSYINTADLIIGIGCILFLRELTTCWKRRQT